MARAFYRDPKKRAGDSFALATPVGLTVHGRTELLTRVEAQNLIAILQACVRTYDAEIGQIPGATAKEKP